MRDAVLAVSGRQPSHWAGAYAPVSHADGVVQIESESGGGRSAEHSTSSRGEMTRLGCSTSLISRSWH